MHQRGTAATQNRLFTEQIRFGFFLEGGFDDAGFAAANGRCVRHRHVACLFGFVLMHRDQHRHTAALCIGAAHGMPRRFGRDHHHVQICPRRDLAIMNIEPVRERQRGAFLDIGRYILTIDFGDVFIGHQHHYKIRTFHGLADILDG